MRPSVPVEERLVASVEESPAPGARKPNPLPLGDSRSTLGTPQAGARSERINLLGMPRTELRAFFEELGEKPYRATQVMKWIYHAGVDDFGCMTDIAKKLRTRLTDIAEIRAPSFNAGWRSADGVVKWLAATRRGQAVETVLIPDGRRNTLCISSQVGCTLDCSFCATGKQGFSGNLDRAEIVGQVWRASRELANRGDTSGISNVVFMGMGEPLLNFDAVMDATDVLLDDLAFGISKRRVTISTAGVVPRIFEMAGRTDISLAVSLHAANDALRDRLVPLNRRYPIAELFAACRHYLASLGERRAVTFEYTLLDGVNDDLAAADELVSLLEREMPGDDAPRLEARSEARPEENQGRRCKINLIPFNPFANDPHGYRRPSSARVARFQRTLLNAGFAAMVRTTRGDEIAAACGQLTGDFQDRTRRRQRYRSRTSAEVAA